MRLCGQHEKTISDDLAVDLHLDAMLALGETGLKTFISSIGLFNMKAKNVIRMAEILIAENARLRSDLGNLARHCEHIREIVVTQQGASHSLGKTEDLDPAQLFEDAIRLNADSLNRHGIRLERSFAAVGPVRADRHRVLQILVNLLHNAKDAVMSVERSKRSIRVAIATHDATHATLSVADNGVGIAPEVRDKIFQHGFTTKPDGHGFGLHSASLAARDMGGRLTLGSDGLGHGATFSLILPLAHLHQK